MGFETLTTQELTNKYSQGGGFTALEQPIIKDISFTDTVAAAFEQDNSIGSFFASEAVNTTNDIEDGYDVFADIQGFENHASKFIGVRNSTRAQAIKDDIKREEDNRRLLDDAGAMGIGASVIASILDPIDWVGTAAGVGLVSKGGKLVKVVAGAAGGVSATEGVLQATQQTRTAAETMLNVAAAPIMSAGLVKASDYIVKLGGRAGVPPHINLDKAGDELVDNMLKGRNPAAAPASVSTRSVASTAPDANLNRVIETFSDDNTLYKEGWSRSMEFERSTGLGEKAAKAQMHITPIGRMAGSVSANVRSYVHAFLENGLVTKGAAKGIAKDIAAETVINRKTSELIVASEDIFSRNTAEAKMAGDTLDAGAFAKEVGKAMSNGDVHANPYVQKTAQEMRQIFDRLKNDAQEVGLLPKELEGVIGAESYFTRVYDRAAIRANSDVFRDMLQREFLEVAEEIKARGEADNMTLHQQGFGLTDKEISSGKVDAKTVRTEVEAILAEKKYLSERDPINSPKSVYDELSEEFADNADIMDIIKLHETTAKGDNPGGLTVMVSEIKKSVLDDIRVNTDPKSLRQAAIQTEANILGDGMVRPSALSFSGANSRVASAFKKRALTINDNVLEPYLEKDALYAARKNVMSMVPQIELMRKQQKLLKEGQKPDLELTQVKANIWDEYKEKLNLLDKDTLVDIIASGKFNRTDLDKVLGTKVADELRDIIMAAGRKTDIGYKVIVDYDSSTGKINLRPRKGVSDDELREALKPMTEEISKKTRKWTDKFNEHHKQDIKDLDATRQMLLGELRYQTDAQSFWTRGLRTLRSVNYMSMLGGMAITSTTDLARHGMVNGLKGFSKFFRSDMWGKMEKSVGKQEMARLGVVAEMVLNKRASELADLSEGVYEKSKFELGLDKMQNSFSKWTGMTYWTDVQKNIAVASTQDIILEAANKIAKGQKLKSDEIVRFAENGLDINSLQRIGEQFAKHGEEVDGLRLSNADKWDDFELGEMYKDVLRKQADMIVITPSVGDRPLWMTGSEVLKSVGQFQTFAFAATNRQVLAGASFNAKNMIAWSLVQLALGVMVTEGKDAMRGKTRKWDTDKETTENIVEYVDRSGIIPLMSYGSKAGQFLGITSRNRFEETQVLGSLLGPSMGTAERVGKIARAAGDGELGSVMEESSKLLPFQNHPLVQLFERFMDFERKDLRRLN